MIELRWGRDTTFVDRELGDKYRGSGVYDVPEERVDTYLERGWVRVDDEEGEGGADEDTEEEEQTTPPDEDNLTEILDGTVDDVSDAVAAIGDEATLNRLRELEAGGDGRQTALDAIDERLDSLSSEDAEGDGD